MRLNINEPWTPELRTQILFEELKSLNEQLKPLLRHPVPAGTKTESIRKHYIRLYTLANLIRAELHKYKMSLSGRYDSFLIMNNETKVREEYVDPKPELQYLYEWLDSNGYENYLR